MRDYIRVFYTVDDSPFFSLASTSHYFFTTPEECDTYIANNPISPGGGTLSPTAPVYFRLNQEKFCQWLNSSYVQNLGPDMLSSGKQMVFLESPRKLGVNSYTEKKQGVSGSQSAAKGDFSGAGGLLQFVLGLPNLAIQLKQEGRVRDAGIVTFVYNQIISGKISVTDGLAILRENRIP